MEDYFKCELSGGGRLSISTLLLSCLLLLDTTHISTCAIVDRTFVHHAGHYKTSYIAILLLLLTAPI